MAILFLSPSCKNKASDVSTRIRQQRQEQQQNSPELIPKLTFLKTSSTSKEKGMNPQSKPSSKNRKQTNKLDYDLQREDDVHALFQSRKSQGQQRRACGEGKRLVRVDEVQQTPLPKTKTKKKTKQGKRKRGGVRTSEQTNKQNKTTDWRWLWYNNLRIQDNRWGR